MSSLPFESRRQANSNETPNRNACALLHTTYGSIFWINPKSRTFEKPDRSQTTPEGKRILIDRMPDHSGRGPLTFIILAQTGEDVRNCINCELCDHSYQGMDLAFFDLVQAITRDDPNILENPILWNCDSLIESKMTCLGGIDIPQVIYALRQEANIRGIGPISNTNQDI